MPDLAEILHFIFFNIFNYLILLVLIPVVVLQRRQDAVATLAWIFFIIAVPYLGALAFLLFGNNRLRRKTRRKLKSDAHLAPLLSNYLGSGHQFRVQESLGFLPEEHHDLIRLSQKLSSFPISRGNEVEVLIDTNRAYGLMEQSIRRARDHVHMEYYIFQPDATGERFRDLLIEKAKEGVEVRFLYDYVGSLSLSAKFLRGMEKAGVKCVAFLPARSWHRHGLAHFRNHRKITVVDGQEAFTGGMNIGDEYRGFRGRKKKLGRWRDTHLFVRGPAAHQLQEVFAEDWYFANGENLNAFRYFPPPIALGDKIVQILASGPDHNSQTIHKIFFAAISSAQKKVYITTPYLVPDQAILTALQTAALRGVDVRLLVPRRADVRLITWAGRSYYHELLETGVKIYEYMPGILHAKVMVVDGYLAIVGSANMDIRSFRYNFEVNASIYSATIGRALEDIFFTDLQACREVDRQAVEKIGFSRYLLENTSRLLSPLL